MKAYEMRLFHKETCEEVKVLTSSINCPFLSAWKGEAEMRERQRIQRHVTSGAAFLDAHNPLWYQNIDLATFDINLWKVCVLGQIYGSYSAGIVALNLQYQDCQVLGFCPHEALGHSDVQYRQLNDYWRAEIYQRRLAHR